ncbi:MAG: hypothetical protein HYT93_01090 [Parcubacteria group bacterium]|nr:hypothetical protein [Parcubacteria group bacterium]
MSLKDHVVVSSVIFLVIFVLHGLRLFLGWDVMLGGWEMPMWTSWIVLVLAGYLSYSGFVVTGYLGSK